MNNREYIYLRKNSVGSYGIMYAFGHYNVARMLERDDGALLTYTLRSYKTISGAERYLLTKIPQGNYDDFRGTESFIKEGSYWRKES